MRVSCFCSLLLASELHTAHCTLHSAHLARTHSVRILLIHRRRWQEATAVALLPKAATKASLGRFLEEGPLTIFSPSLSSRIHSLNHFMHSTLPTDNPKDICSSGCYLRFDISEPLILVRHLLPSASLRSPCSFEISSFISTPFASTRLEESSRSASSRLPVLTSICAEHFVFEAHTHPLEGVYNR